MYILGNYKCANVGILYIYLVTCKGCATNWNIIVFYRDYVRSDFFGQEFGEKTALNVACDLNGEVGTWSGY